ncbi:MAG: alpha-L-fucosidase, partial [Chitinophagaceae bacterium]
MPTIIKKGIPLFLFCLSGLLSKSQPKIDPASIRPKMQWFADAKLGIFIHAGIYSVKGVDESWGFYNKKIPY